MAEHDCTMNEFLGGTFALCVPCVPPQMDMLPKKVSYMKKNMRAWWPGVPPPPEKSFVTPTQTNVHRDALCFMVKTWATHKKQWLAVGGWRLAVSGCELVVGGWWSFAVGRPWGLSLSAVLIKTKKWAS